jgi:ankyrin repeat protein
MAAVLLAGGASTETRNVHLATPLILAAQVGAAEVVELLLERGADPDAREIGGSTPLEIATRRRHHDVVRLLRKHGAGTQRPNASLPRAPGG